MKKRNLLILLAISAAVAITIGISCKKSEKMMFVPYNSANATFTVKAAKHWYYSVFKKDSLYGKSFLSSMYSNAKPQKKYPMWGVAESKVVGPFQIVEMPLVNTNKTVAMPTKGRVLSSEEYSKIAQHTRERVAFIKNGTTGKVQTRIEQFVPDISYLRSHNNVLPINSMTKIATDFTGWGMIRDWNDRVIAQIRYENGKRVGHLNQVVKSSTRNAHTECFTIQVPLYDRVCLVIPSPGLDDPNMEPDDDECTSWGEAFKGYETIQDCYEVEDDPCENLTDAQCLCLTMALCGDGDDGGNGSTDPDEQCVRSDAEGATTIGEFASNSEAANGTLNFEGDDQGVDANGDPFKKSTMSIEFWNTKLPGGYQPCYSAYYWNVVHKDNAQQWVFDTCYYTGYDITRGAVPPCAGIDINVTKPVENFENANKKVSVGFIYVAHLKIACVGGWQVANWPGKFSVSYTAGDASVW